jgi:hypothetical protein
MYYYSSHLEKHHHSLTVESIQDTIFHFYSLLKLNALNIRYTSLSISYPPIISWILSSQAFVFPLWKITVSRSYWPCQIQESVFILFSLSAEFDAPDSLSSFSVVLGFWTQGLALSMQALYHLNLPPALFKF